MNFHVGQRVVCVETWVDDPNRLGRMGEEGPVAGHVYTIREIGMFHPMFPDSVNVRLVEIVNAARDYCSPSGDVFRTWEPSFGAFRFRPVVDRKTDISVFQAMLTGKKVEADA